MPSWGMHLAIANRLIKKLEIDNKQKNEFLFANILPDINNGYVVKGISSTIPHRKTHFELKEYKEKNYKPGYINFYEKYKENIKNPIILGYLVHLMTDYYFNNTTYTEYGVFDEKQNRIGVKLNNGQNFIGDDEECRKIKVNDFKIFSYYIYINEKLEIPKYEQSILNHTEIIEEIKISSEDEEKVIQYVESCVNGPKQILNTIENEEYKIYTREELKRRVELCVDFILKQINEQ